MEQKTFDKQAEERATELEAERLAAEIPADFEIESLAQLEALLETL